MSVREGEAAPVAVVTGGCSGIGQMTTQRLSSDGYRVAVIDLGFTPDADLSVKADVTDPAGVEAAVSEILHAFGRVDLLVNNAGITGSAEATVCHETPVEQWDLVHAVNVKGPFLCTRAMLPAMLSQKSGHVITLASVAGLVAFPGRCAYTASKGAAIAFTRSLAVDYAAAGIRANAICPGMVETPMTRGDLMFQSFAPKWSRRSPWVGWRDLTRSPTRFRRLPPTGWPT